jgi:hypothetical protein
MKSGGTIDATASKPCFCSVKEGVEGRLSDQQNLSRCLG